MPVNTISANRVQYDWYGDRYILPPSTTDRQGRLVGPYGWVCRAKQLQPRMNVFKAGSAVAIDCEGVILDNEESIRKKGCGRFSVTTEDGKVIYDTFVYYPVDVPHRPPPQRLNLGVKYPDILRYNGAQPIAEVVKVAEQIFNKAGVIVGHAIENEMHMLRDVDWNSHQSKIRDTQQFSEYRRYNGGRPPGLDMLAAEVLGQRGLQAHGHSSVKDARATMKLYLLRRDAIDRSQDRSLYDQSQWAMPANASSSDGFGGWWSELEKSESSRTAPSAGDSLPPTGKSDEAVRAVTTGAAASLHQSATQSASRTRTSKVVVALPNLPHVAARAGGRRWDPSSSRYI